MCTSWHIASTEAKIHGETNVAPETRHPTGAGSTGESGARVDTHDLRESALRVAKDVIRKIRDRHARRLAGKTPEEVIAFYRAAGRTAGEDAQRDKPRRRRAS